MPAAQATLVLLHHGGQHRRHQRRHALRRSQNDGRTHGIALVRHCRRTAAPCRGRLERFADFGLHQERHIARQLAQRADEETQRRGDFGDAIAMRMPRHVGKREVEFVRQRGRDRESLFA